MCAHDLPTNWCSLRNRKNRLPFKDGICSPTQSCSPFGMGLCTASGPLMSCPFFVLVAAFYCGPVLRAHSTRVARPPTPCSPDLSAPAWVRASVLTLSWLLAPAHLSGWQFTASCFRTLPCPVGPCSKTLDEILTPMAPWRLRESDHTLFNPCPKEEGHWVG